MTQEKRTQFPTLNTTPDSRTGAQAALSAIALLHGAYVNSRGGTYEQVDPVDAARIVIDALGETLSPRTAGFLATLAHYISNGFGGAVDIDVFEADVMATRTEEEQIEVRRRQQAELEESSW